MVEIRLATKTDIDALVAHKARHMQEPGFEGKLAHPFPLNHNFDWQARKADLLISMEKSIRTEGWSRNFILLIDGEILGEVNLKNIFDGTLHRAQLGMGLEQSVRGQGFGKRLLKTAIDWAKSEESLFWVDLSYFSYNLPAKKLYESLGFKELFVYEDRLRVEGVVIDDVYMALKLK